MMPHEHYVRAEELIEGVEDLREKFKYDSWTPALTALQMEGLKQLTLEAQVHATLAQVGTKVNARAGTVEMEET